MNFSDSLSTALIEPLLTAAVATAKAIASCSMLEQRMLSGGLAPTDAQYLLLQKESQAHLAAALAQLSCAQDAAQTRFSAMANSGAPQEALSECSEIRAGDWVEFGYHALPGAIEGEDYARVSSETALGRFLLGRRVGSVGLLEEPALGRTRVIQVTAIQPANLDIP